MNDPIEELDPFQANYKELLQVEKWDTLHREMRNEELEKIIEELQMEIVEVSMLAYDPEIQSQSYYQVKGEEPEIVKDENYIKAQEKVNQDIQKEVDSKKKDFERMRKQVKSDSTYSTIRKYINENFQLVLIVFCCVLTITALWISRALCGKRKEEKKDLNGKKNKKKNK